MRKRVVRVAVVAAMVALVLLATPLAVGIPRSFIADERGELERAALAAAVRVGAKSTGKKRSELPPGERDARIGLYDLAGRLRDGHGPATADAVTRRAMAGVVARGRDGQDLVAAVPVSTAERVTGVVRAADGTQGVWARVGLAWAALVGTALAALATGVLVARHQARTLSAPLEALSATAVAVAGGDLTARAGRSAIAEIDQVARTQNTMVERLTTLLEHERQFSANASHQLRTPLAGLQLGLEAAAADPGADLARLRAAIEEALERSRHLQQTVDEVLRLARAAPGPRLPERSGPLGELAESVERRWHGAFAAEGRRLDFAFEPGSETIRVPDRTAEQILDVLLDNALRHGSGTVGVTVREMTGAVAVDVADEGSLALEPGLVFARGTTTSRSGSGIGLPLARDMARAAGGRLTLVRASPTTFTLLLPMPEGE
ncbi:HAMP domain-containing sensor histidine kinase [Streptomyces lonegramiae]|uniref:histidine kinase n=1 Tax=Streptomyces lonegramiae TaxID=3075524 RepID=A0ABU2XKR8_9ACTN|nr:HAMP domain-containing sensor histidine kinase [Streptomyces sp. DSM 41529]MDT0546496.1 HAMP domain-containing sensor histidine kinase [Streptomyces sp. DSM 41529]